MNVEVQKSFERDIEKITNPKTAEQISTVIEELETVATLAKISNVKKMKARGNYYRIRVGNYRMGFRFDSPDTIVLLRFMDRKDIYKYFP